jgi:hypothetical protein
VAWPRHRDEACWDGASVVQFNQVLHVILRPPSGHLDRLNLGLGARQIKPGRVGGLSGRSAGELRDQSPAADLRRGGSPLAPREKSVKSCLHSLIVKMRPSCPTRLRSAPSHGATERTCGDRRLEMEIPIGSVVLSSWSVAPQPREERAQGRFQLVESPGGFESLAQDQHRLRGRRFRGPPPQTRRRLPPSHRRGCPAALFGFF